jgi:hypothetical protein
MNSHKEIATHPHKSPPELALPGKVGTVAEATIECTPLWLGFDERPLPAGV